MLFFDAAAKSDSQPPAISMERLTGKAEPTVFASEPCLTESAGRRLNAQTAVERVVLRAIQDLASARQAKVDGRPFQQPVLEMSEACHALVDERGGFKVATDRQRRLAIVPKHFRRLARLFGAMDAVHRLNMRGRTATQRELFYRAQAEGERRIFGSQAHMNNALRDAVGVLGIGRPHLGVLTAEKGLVAGAVRFKNPQTGAMSSAQHPSGLAVGEALLGDANVDLSGARCVLVLEKDSFFQHLLQGQLLAALPLVLVTGRGYPDLLTRRLLQKLQRVAPHLPHVYLGDYDPHGVSIFLQYRASCPELHWLGMHEADVKGLPAAASVPMTTRDRALQASLLRHPAVLESEAFRSQILAMECKFELEALHSAHGADSIARNFVPEKILRRQWL